MSTTTGNERILSKLTVPQLKALCKEKKVSGYSKLGKQALLQKLVEAGYSPDDNLVIASPAPAIQISAPKTAASATDSADNPSIAEPCASLTRGPAALSKSHDKPTRRSSPKAKSKGKKTASCVDSSSATNRNTTSTLLLRGAAGIVPTVSANASVSTRIVSLQEGATNGLTVVPATGTSFGPLEANEESLNYNSSGRYLGEVGPTSDLLAGASETIMIKSPPANVKGKKRSHASEEVMPPPPKKTRIQPRSAITGLHQAPSSPGHTSSRPTVHSGGTISANVSRPLHTQAASTRGPVSAAKSSLPPAKRFKPLVVDKARCVTASSGPAPSGAPASTLRSSNVEDVSYYLDFPVSKAPLPALRSITLPPPLAQRKRVARWAIILSGLSDKERAVCILVSRTFRYAVYLSASSILMREYCGHRLQQDVLRAYPKAMTNMWPYLRLREVEVAERRRMYETSFLPRFFRRCGVVNPIAAHLWASPDNARQITIALRFVLTRAWFELSLGHSDGSNEDPKSWLRGTVIDVQEVVQGDVWSVTIQYPRTAAQVGARETLHVLASTCEVVGRPERDGPDAEEGPISASVNVRADWSAYIANYSAPSSDAISLLSRLKWPCREEFVQGISKLWLKRIEGEGDLGQAKRTVAERYVLASVVGNSVSGRWMSASAMAQEFAGLTARVAPIASGSTKPASLNLYLPEHHHVESVHFTTSRGERLHAALAAVQTPRREYFILRDNGMQVGCEEEGVAEVWQEVLECDDRGRPTRSERYCSSSQ
ncbi:hypothetical protein PYCCODRAFT_1403229 [Trametes coccinea BRFM310]|uniref:Rho termination factor N-terminal domain-containing protein n=1 Tax=Trametes coccinea (strain BRFM310) TaxID=1353009 RepID=A0A1Y2J435_TRAC3|nr:hypothetical protein PYCCODRAFT_1403229 [Trametes coccinea BRFM310]